MTQWPAQSAFDEIAPRGSHIERRGPIEISVSAPGKRGVLATLSLRADFCDDLGWIVGQRFKLKSVETKSGVFVRLVPNDRGGWQLSEPARKPKHGRPRYLIRFGAALRGSRAAPIKRAAPEHRVHDAAESGGIGPQELEFLVPADAPVKARPAEPDVCKSGAAQAARRLYRAGLKIDAIVEALAEQQNVNVREDWVERAVEAGEV